MMRRVGDKAASMTPTMLGMDKHENNGHMAKFWKPVGEEGNW